MTDWLTPDELGRIEGVLEQTIPNEATRIIVSLMAHAAEADRRIEALSAQVAALENERSDLRLARDQWKSAAHEWVAARDLRDDVIRELADALRATDIRHTDFCGSDACSGCFMDGLRSTALARVDALTGGGLDRQRAVIDALYQLDVDIRAGEHLESTSGTVER